MEQEDYRDEGPPAVSKELLDYLESIIPPVDTTPLQSREDSIYYGGKRSIVKFLKDLHKNQSNY